MAQPFRAAQPPVRGARAAGEVRLRSVRMGLESNQPAMGSPSAPVSNANFSQKVIDGLLKLPYTDKCRWQAFPPSRKPFDASLSFADPAAGLFSSGPAVSAGRRGFHTPLSTLVGHISLFEFPRESASRLSSQNAQLCAFRRYAVALWYYGSNYERRAQWRRCPNRTRITLRPS